MQRVWEKVVAHPGVVDDEVEAAGDEEDGGAREVDEAEVDEASWSWRVRPREADVEEEEDAATRFPRSGEAEGSHGDDGGG